MKIRTFWSRQRKARVHRITPEGTSRYLMLSDTELAQLAHYYYSSQAKEAHIADDRPTQ